MVGFAQFISTFQSWVVLYSGESVESESGDGFSGCLDLDGKRHVNHTENSEVWV